jgi:predicted lysophospholipase L1 biosynthesis ABC-type transport system permease subunit
MMTRDVCLQIKAMNRQVGTAVTLFAAFGCSCPLLVLLVALVGHGGVFI